MKEPYTTLLKKKKKQNKKKRNKMKWKSNPWIRYKKRNNFQENGSCLWIQKKLSLGKLMKKLDSKFSLQVIFHIIQTGKSKIRKDLQTSFI